MRLTGLRTFTLAALITALILGLAPLVTATSFSSMRLEEGDIEAAPYIMIYKADGNYPMNHWVNPDCTHPIINVGNNNASIRVSVGISGSVYYPAGQGTLMNGGGYLTKVSYSASWQGNKETVVYTDDATNHQGGYQFNLTGIPYGNQSINVYATGNILLFEDGFASTYPVPQSGSQSVGFTVARASTQPTLDVSLKEASAQEAVETGYAYAIVIILLVSSAVAIAVVAKKLKPKITDEA